MLIFLFCFSFQKYATLQEEYYTLKERSLEQEQTLEELGVQLSVSKLKIMNLKEEASRNKVDGIWAKDKNATSCKSCSKEFNLTRRKVRVTFFKYTLEFIVLFAASLSTLWRHFLQFLFG